MTLVQFGRQTSCAYSSFRQYCVLKHPSGSALWCYPSKDLLESSILWATHPAAEFQPVVLKNQSLFFWIRFQLLQNDALFIFFCVVLLRNLVCMINFIKHHMNKLLHNHESLVVDPIGLTSWRIANEDAIVIFLIKLAHIFFPIIHNETSATKHF